MSAVDNRTTRSDNNQQQTTNIIDDQNSIPIIKKSLQIKNSIRLNINKTI